MKHTRFAKLEKHARERPCPGCGRVVAAARSRDEALDIERLGADEQRELALLIEATLPPCPQCGWSERDLARMTDEQLDRALYLLRVLYEGSELECIHAAQQDVRRAVKSVRG